MKKYDFYFASPFFNPEQCERETRMIHKLRTMGFTVFSPREDIMLAHDASVEERRLCFRHNLEAINNSNAVFAVTDGKDVGTIWEAGYAYGKDIPVVYYAETLGTGKFNVMLAQSGMICFQSSDDISYDALRQAIVGRYREEYIGAIE